MSSMIQPEPTASIGTYLSKFTPMNLVVDLARKNRLDRLTVDHLEFMATHSQLYTAYLAAPDTKLCLIILDACGVPVHSVALRRYLYQVLQDLRVCLIRTRKMVECDMPYRYIDDLGTAVYGMSGTEAEVGLRTAHVFADQQTKLHENPELGALWDLAAYVSGPTMDYDTAISHVAIAQQITAGDLATDEHTFRRIYANN